MASTLLFPACAALFEHPVGQFLKIVRTTRIAEENQFQPDNSRVPSQFSFAFDRNRGSAEGRNSGRCYGFQLQLLSGAQDLHSDGICRAEGHKIPNFFIVLNT